MRTHAHHTSTDSHTRARTHTNTHIALKRQPRHAHSRQISTGLSITLATPQGAARHNAGLASHWHHVTHPGRGRSLPDSGPPPSQTCAPPPKDGGPRCAILRDESAPPVGCWSAPLTRPCPRRFHFARVYPRPAALSPLPRGVHHGGGTPSEAGCRVAGLRLRGLHAAFTFTRPHSPCPFPLIYPRPRPCSPSKRRPALSLARLSPSPSPSAARVQAHSGFPARAHTHARTHAHARTHTHTHTNTRIREAPRGFPPRGSPVFLRDIETSGVWAASAVAGAVAASPGSFPSLLCLSPSPAAAPPRARVPLTRPGDCSRDLGLLKPAAHVAAVAVAAGDRLAVGIEVAAAPVLAWHQA